MDSKRISFDSLGNLANVIVNIPFNTYRIRLCVCVNSVLSQLFWGKSQLQEFVCLFQKIELFSIPILIKQTYFLPRIIHTFHSFCIFCVIWHLWNLLWQYPNTQRIVPAFLCCFWDMYLNLTSNILIAFLKKMICLQSRDIIQ